MQSGFPHGSIERSASRNRSRDRQTGSASIPLGAYRMNPAGEQEAADWMHTLDSVTTRVEALGRNLRSHAQAMGKIEMQQNELGTQHQTFSTALSETNATLESSNGVVARMFWGDWQSFRNC